MKNLFTNLMKNTAKSSRNTGGGASQCQTSRSEGARQITARFESAQMKNTSLISGCSAVDVPMPSYGASDEHPMSTRSASDGRRWHSRGWKYVACMLMVLFVGVGNVWGVDPDIEFKTMTSVVYDSKAKTYTDSEYFIAHPCSLVVSTSVGWSRTETASVYYYAPKVDKTDGTGWITFKYTLSDKVIDRIELLASTNSSSGSGTTLAVGWIGWEEVAANNGIGEDELKPDVGGGVSSADKSYNTAVTDTVLLVFDFSEESLREIRIAKKWNSISLSSGSTVSYPNSGQQTIRVYGFRVWLRSSGGGSDPDPECNEVAAPTSLSCSAQTQTSLTFGWTAASNASGYVAKLWDNSSCTGDAVATENIASGSTETVTFTGLTAGTTYYCKVQSKGDGSTYCAAGDTTDAASGTTSACTAISPSIVYPFSTIAIGILPSITISDNLGNGDVSYSSSNTSYVNTNTANNVGWARAAGTATVTATVAANGAYCSNTATKAFTVVSDQIGLIKQTLPAGSVAWGTPSVPATTDETNITSTTAIAAVGEDYTISPSSNNGNTNNGTQTCKIPSLNSYDASKYLALGFTVKSGKQLNVSAIYIPVQPVTTDEGIFKAVLTDDDDDTDDIEGTISNIPNGHLDYIQFPSYGVVRGNVTLKIYAYGWTNGYRMGKSIVIDGEIEDAAPSCTTLDAPTGLSCTGHTSASLTFGWTAVTNASSYDVKLWNNSACTGEPIKSDNVTTNSKTFTGLDDETTYYCKVQAKGDGETYCTNGGTTAAASETTDALPSYTVTAATSTGDNTLGTVSAAASSIKAGATTTITAVPAAGYRVASWAVSGTGATISPSGASNSLTTTLTMGTANATVTVTFEEIPCPTSGTVYSAVTTATGDISIAASASNLELNSSTHKTTVSGGKMYVYNGQTSAKELITSNGFALTNGNTYFHIQLDCALEAGDTISVKVGKNSSIRGVWISSTRTDKVPDSAPACALTTTETDSELKAVTYIVTGSDEYHGKNDFYIYRATGSSTYFNNVKITRPAKYAVTYSSEKGEAPSDVSAASVTLAEITGVSGWKNTGWKANVATEVGGASVDANTLIENGSVVTLSGATTFTAQWAQTYLLTYDANGGSDAPSEEYRVAGAAALSSTEPTRDGYRFLGWNTARDGSGDHYEAGASYTMETSAATLYAEWQEEATLTWNLLVNTTATPFGTHGASGNTSSNTTRIAQANMTDLASEGIGLYDSGKSAVSGKTAALVSTDGKDNNKYVYVTFQVAENYEFVPTSLVVPVSRIAINSTWDAVLTDGVNSLSGTYTSTADGNNNIVFTNVGNVAFSGTVTLKIWAYCSGGGGYRLVTPITITGDVNYVCPARATITSPTAPQDIKLYTDRTKTLTVEATPYSSGILHYQWKKDGANIVGATYASHTVYGSIDGTVGESYVYTCEVTQTSPDACAIVTSPAFTVTIASPDCGQNIIAEAVLNGTSSTSTLTGGTLLQKGLDGSGPYKLNGKPSWFGIKMSSNFQVGDSIIFKLKVGDWWSGANVASVPVVVFAGQNLSKEVYRTVALTAGTDNTYVRFAVTQEMIDDHSLRDTIMIWRSKTNDASCTECCTQNHQMYSVQVKRYGCPDIFIYDDAAGTSEWSDDDNWIGPAGHGSGLPTSSDRIIINKSITIDTEEATAGELIITNGSTVTVEKSITVGDVSLNDGSTLNIAKDGESGITVATNSLYLRGGWNETSSSYDMPRVYIDPASTLTKEVETVNYDISVDASNYYPFAVPFRVRVKDVDYANSTLAYYSEYGQTGQYVIKEYDGASRAENGPNPENWKVVPREDEGGDVYLEPGRGYIMTAVSIPAYGGGVIRFPMTVDNAWTADGEKGTATISAVEKTKNTVEVTAYTGTAAAANKMNAGWNMLGVPYMSCFGTKDGISGTATILDGHMTITGAYEDNDVQYVSVPVHDFSEYLQFNIADGETVLKPGWCFLIQAATTGSLTFAVDHQKTSSDLPIYAPKREQENKPTVKTGIILSGAEASDKTTILVSDKYSAAEYEINADLEKIFGNGYTLATYSLMGASRLAYNALSNADAANLIPIGYRAPEEGEYTFSINPRYAENSAFKSVNLIDYETGVVTDLMMYSYTFFTDRTQNDSRFAINVEKQKDTPTDVENVQGDEVRSTKVRKLILNDKVYIIRGAQMYDATGKRVEKIDK